jgi:hypothetical protein
VSGLTQAGQTLTASVGTWSGSPTSFGYQWQRCRAAGVQCTAILGATGGSYQLTAGDIGDFVTVVVTATGKGGSAAVPAVVPTAVVAAPVPTAVPGSAAVVAGAAGAVTTTDGTATVTWQPGAIASGSTVSLAHSGNAISFTVQPAVAALPWPVEFTFGSASTDVVGYSTDGTVWLPATVLKTAALPLGTSVGAFRDSTGIPHVLLRLAARVRLFTPGAYGDPRLVSAAPPQPRLIGRLKVTRLRSGAVVVAGRAFVPSQAFLTTNVVGRTSARHMRVLKPGGVPLQVAVRIPPGVFGSLRVAARDPWGRTAALLVRFRAP